MTIISTGFAKTQNASRYLQQLCKHWSHEFEVEFDTLSGKIHFSDVIIVDLTAQDDGIAIEFHMPDTAGLDALRDVVSKHLDRFAFREAPLPYLWDDAA